jgi:hypothetical protein
MLIVILAWPARHAKEFLLRLAMPIPLMAMLPVRGA